MVLAIYLMEIAILTQNSLRIKGKNVTLVTLPSSVTTKTPADATLSLIAGESLENAKIEGSRVAINASGEYEVSGAKIVGMQSGDDVVYSMHIDGLNILLGAIEAIETVLDKLLDKHHIVITIVAGKLNEETITSLEPQVALLVGDSAKDGAKVLGKEASPTSKYATTLEKLPAEMEVAVLASS